MEEIEYEAELTFANVSTAFPNFFNPVWFLGWLYYLAFSF